MKVTTLTAAAFVAFAGAAFAQTTLTTAAQEQVMTLSPTLDVTALTPIQIGEINDKVASADGLDESELMTIVGDTDGMK